MGGSGGGSSGAVSFPTYLQNIHEQFLAGPASVDQPSNSMCDAFNAAYGNSPFAGLSAYNPASDLSDAQTVFDSFITDLSAISLSANDYVANYDTLANGIQANTATADTATLDSAVLDTALIVSDTTTLETMSINNVEVDADINEFAALLNQQLEAQTLPAFRTAMLSIGAINTSAFVIGEAYLRALMARDVAKYGTEIRSKVEVQNYELNADLKKSYRQIEAQLKMDYRRRWQEALTQYRQIQADHYHGYRTIEAEHKRVYQEITARHKVQWADDVTRAASQVFDAPLKQIGVAADKARLAIDFSRIKVIAGKEYVGEQSDLAEKDGLWDLSIFQYPQNLMAGPSGGVHQNQPIPSKATSALAGALSGAATGAAVGTSVGQPVIGAAAGLVIGVGASLAR